MCVNLRLWYCHRGETDYPLDNISIISASRIWFFFHSFIIHFVISLDLGQIKQEIWAFHLWEILLIKKMTGRLIMKIIVAALCSIFFPLYQLLCFRSYKSSVLRILQHSHKWRYGWRQRMSLITSDLWMMFWSKTAFCFWVCSLFPSLQIRHLATSVFN